MKLIITQMNKNLLLFLSSSPRKDVVLLTISKSITLIVSVIHVMLLSRIFTLYEYGTLNQLLLVSNIFVSIVIIGLPSSINYFLAKVDSKIERINFLNTYFSLSNALSVLCGLILLSISPLIAKFLNNETITQYYFFWIVIPWTKIILSSIDNIFVVLRKTSALVIFKVLHSFSLLFTVVFVKLCNLTFQQYIFLFVIFETLFSISFICLINKLIGKIKFSIDKKLLKKVFGFSLPIGLATIIATLNIQFDKLVISRFFSVDQLAIYSNAAKELPILIFSSSLVSVLMPRIVKLLHSNKTNEAIILWGKSIQISFFVIVYFVGILIVFSSEIITLLYSAKFLPGATVFKIYSLVLLFRFTYFGIILNSKGCTNFILYSSIISIILNVILNIILCTAIGFIGPAIASLISIGLVNFIQLIYTSKAINVSFSKLLPWKNISYIGAVGLFFGILFNYIKIYLSFKFFWGNIIELILLCAAWAILYLLIIIFVLRIKING